MMYRQKLVLRSAQAQARQSGKKGGKTPPAPISSVMAGVISQLGIGKNYHGWSVVTHWPEIVGEQIARRAKALKFDDGQLIVAVPDASWRQELAMQLDELMQKIHSFPGGRVIKELRLVRGEKG
jgi:predicted nucleic acid-binding Zn ribbon protein